MDRKNSDKFDFDFIDEYCDKLDELLILKRKQRVKIVVAFACYMMSILGAWSLTQSIDNKL